MAGIYIHIPFCRKACTYCNFHFSTNLKTRPELLKALGEELRARREELGGEEIKTLYFGGGTPSLLAPSEIAELCKIVSDNYPTQHIGEITIEANPDDIHPSYLQELYDNAPVNRISLGIQSFVEADLKFMNRAHSAEEAAKSLELLTRFGHFALSVDLIYGSPHLSDAAWAENLKKVLSTGIPHLSCYALTVEEKTALAYQISQKISPPLEEERAARHFEQLLAAIQTYGYEQYEISNFCKNEQYAQHNTSYWKGQKYLGIGAAAHSFDGQKRRWNIANNNLYIKGVALGEGYWEEEVLSPENIFNEYLLTGFRTKWGVEKQRLEELSPTFAAAFAKNVQKYTHTGAVLETTEGYRLSDAGKLLTDRILGEVFV